MIVWQDHAELPNYGQWNEDGHYHEENSVSTVPGDYKLTACHLICEGCGYSLDDSSMKFFIIGSGVYHMKFATITNPAKLIRQIRGQTDSAIIFRGTIFLYTNFYIIFKKTDEKYVVSCQWKINLNQRFFL